MDNATRQALLTKVQASGYPGSIIDVFQAHEQGVDLVDQYFKQQEKQRELDKIRQGMSQSMQQPPSQEMPMPSQAKETMMPPQKINYREAQTPTPQEDKLIQSQATQGVGLVNTPTGSYKGETILRTGGNKTLQEIAMYEWNSERPKQYLKGGLRTKAINRFANGGPTDPPANTTTPPDEWYKNWYSKRQELPQFKDIAKQRLDYLNANPTQVQTISDEEMKNLSGSDTTIGLYYPADEVEADKYGNKVLVTDKGLKEQGDNLVTHETLHKLDFEVPQKNTSIFFKPTPRIKNYENYLPIIEEGDAPITEEEIRSAKEQALSDTNPRWRDPMYRIIPSEYYTPRGEAEENSITTGFENQKQVNYQYSPTELRARLNVWRRQLNLDPTKDYSVEEIDQLMKDNPGMGNPNIRELYKIVRGNPALLKELHDTYVIQPTKEVSDTYTAKLGGFAKMLYNKPKYKK